jgi:hypothetical protein
LEEQDAHYHRDVKTFRFASRLPWPGAGKGDAMRHVLNKQITVIIIRHSISEAVIKHGSAEVYTSTSMKINVKLYKY